MLEGQRERAILVGLDLTGQGRKRAPVAANAEESVAELAALAGSAGADVLASIIQKREGPEAATLIGSGKLDELISQVKARQADVVIFDSDLSPTQQRNLERAVGTKVVDRTQLILDIFARRARTREGQLQVELAQLNYLLPRLAGRGIEMSRLGGGIGTRGPGETQLETDRRRIFRRIRKIEGELERVRAGRSVQRRQRQSVPLQTIALAGYTNAGKSTLFNRLTGAGVEADARMFATLDPTVRAVTLPSRRRALLSDTVGFLRNLPPTLIKAFRATLEEVTGASLLLHVVDVSSPAASEHARQVMSVLAGIGSESTPQLLVLNKTDLVEGGLVDPAALRERIAAGAGGPLLARAVAVSARSGAGIDELLAAIDEILPFDPVSPATFRIPLNAAAAIHVLHERARVKAVRYTAESCEIDADVPLSVQRELGAFRVNGISEA